jgi:hypothetical protein
VVRSFQNLGTYLTFGATAKDNHTLVYDVITISREDSQNKTKAKTKQKQSKTKHEENTIMMKE